MNKEVAKKQTTAVSTEVIDMSKYAGKGSEGVDKDSAAVPFLAVLQSNSPALQTVEGAKAGMFMNTITNELFDIVTIVPFAFERTFIQWGPDNGGFKGKHNPADIDTGKIETDYNEKRKLILKGTLDELKDTRQHYVMMQSASGSWQPAVFSLSSTQIKKSKNFVALWQGIEDEAPDGTSYNPPSWAYMYNVTAISETNEKGSWYGVTIMKSDKVEDPDLFAACVKFNEDYAAGLLETVEPKKF